MDHAFTLSLIRRLVLCVEGSRGLFDMESGWCNSQGQCKWEGQGREIVHG